MPKPKFDPSKVIVTRNGLYYDFPYKDNGVTYYENKRLTQNQEKLYRKWLNKGSNSKIDRGTVNKKYTKYFPKGTKFTSQQGHIHQWAKPLALSGGSNSSYNWSSVKYEDFDGSVKRVSSKQKWGANINKGGIGGAKSAVVFDNIKQWIRHLQITMHQVRVQAENFRVMAGKRALKIFQSSFKFKRFYTTGSYNWQPLSPYTIKKRASRGTGSVILKEYGDLYRSIKLKENDGPNTTSIYTDIVEANTSHKKKRSICYAGYHNEGRGTYGNGWGKGNPKPYIQRQFIGHSSHLDPNTDQFMKKMMKLYLFDSVFLVKKV